jgi:hypothetical protein
MNRKSEGLHRQFRTQSNVTGAVSRRAGLVALTGNHFLDQILVDTGLGDGRI